jgi:hypothetical protein
MPGFRGYFALNGTELVNSSRTVAHLGKITPKYDFVLGSDPNWTCTLTESQTGLYEIPVTSSESADYPGLYTPPDGSYRYDGGLYAIGDCWLPNPLCGCVLMPWVTFDDTWTGLQDFLTDSIYRPELAPWYNVRIPQSAEFGGIWVMSMQGLGPVGAERPLSEMVGSGAIAGPERDGSRTITFSALMIACTNAGLQYGLEWLTCQLRSTNDSTNSTLQFFAAHPGDSAANPSTLVRELHNVVMTQGPQVTQQFNASGKLNQQETVALVSFALTALNPYSWFSALDVPVTWDVIDAEQISWVPTVPVPGAPPPGCNLPGGCVTPPLVSATCPPPTVVITTDSTPPVCGGELPVMGITRYTYNLPTMLVPNWCPGTAVTMTITNNSDAPLTCQGYWKLATDPEGCSERDQFPVQISGLPGFASVTLDGISGKYCATYNGVQVVPVGIVGTPTGAPWLPPFLDRTLDWQFEIIADQAANFSVSFALYDQDVA